MSELTEIDIYGILDLPNYCSSIEIRGKANSDLSFIKFEELDVLSGSKDFGWVSRCGTNNFQGGRIYRLRRIPSTYENGWMSYSGEYDQALTICGKPIKVGDCLSFRMPLNDVVPD